MLHNIPCNDAEWIDLLRVPDRASIHCVAIVSLSL